MIVFFFFCLQKQRKHIHCVMKSHSEPSQQHGDHLSMEDLPEYWPSDLHALADLDRCFRCPICNDVFDIAVFFTECNHTCMLFSFVMQATTIFTIFLVCSGCIRRALAHADRCPICRKTVTEGQLKPNWMVNELVKRFSAAR